MPQRKPYNINTKYGRKKLREQSAQNYANMTPEERSSHDQMGCVLVLIIFAIVCGIVLLFSGPEGLLKYLSK
jgi:hypothetical protein